ncbi:hypothetical protein D3C75_365110 [compost metagenome]
MQKEETVKKVVKRKPVAKVLLRLEFEERDALNAKAAEAGFSVNELLKKLIQGGRIYKRDDSKKELTRARNTHLNRINSNLNMLAKHANYHREEADAVLMHVGLKQIRRELQALLGQWGNV